MDVLVIAPLARGKGQCGDSERLASITARERLLDVDDRRGVSTTGDSPAMLGVDDRRGISTTGDSVVKLSYTYAGSPPDAWSLGPITLLLDCSNVTSNLITNGRPDVVESLISSNLLIL